MRAEELKGCLDALLLAALEGSPRHGYAVIEALRRDAGGRLALPTGTVYPALRGLEQAGLIAGSWLVVAGRRRCCRLRHLVRQLPGPVVEELADGLEETCRRHLGLGLSPDAAAAAAVAEFGAPELIAAEFARAHPARRAARHLLVTGPLVGSCWAAALIIGRA